MKAIWTILLVLAGAAAGAPVRDGPAVVDLVSEVDSIAPGQPFTVAFRMDLDPGWHAYWINPGDSGLPPRLTWTLPEGFTAGELRFPPPVAISTPPFMTYGLESPVWLLATIHPPAGLVPDQVVDLSVRADWLVCKEACVPGSAELSLRLPVTAQPPPPSGALAAEIAAARARLPAPAEGWRFRAESARGRIRLRAFPPGRTAPDLSAARFFPFAPGLVRAAAPQSWRREAAAMTLDLVLEDPAAPLPARLAGVLVARNFALLVDAPFAEDAPRSSSPERNPP